MPPAPPALEKKSLSPHHRQGRDAPQGVIEVHTHADAATVSRSADRASGLRRRTDRQDGADGVLKVSLLTHILVAPAS